MRCAAALPLTRDVERASTANYSIGIVYGLGVREDGTPETHALNKLLKLREMLNSKEVERGVIAGWREAKPAAEYFIKIMGVPEDKVDVDMGRSFVAHMYHIPGIVRSWRREGKIPDNIQIPSDVLLHHIVQTWAVGRAGFDAEWVIPRYHSRVHGIVDGRPKEVVWEVDESEEPRRMTVDQWASKLPVLSAYRPDLAQCVAFALYGLFKDRSVFKSYGKRLLP